MFVVKHNDIFSRIRTSAASTRSPLNADSVEGELVPIRFFFDQAAGCVFESRGDERVKLEGALLHRRIAENADGTVLEVMSLIKAGRLRVDSNMSSLYPAIIVAIVGNHLLHVRAQRALGHQFLVSAIRTMMTGRAPLSPELLRVLGDPAFVHEAVASHMENFKTVHYAKRVVKKEKVVLPETLEERVASYVEVFTVEGVTGNFEKRVAEFLERHAWGQAVGDMRFCALYCATDLRLDGLFKHVEPTLLLKLAAIIETEASRRNLSYDGYVLAGELCPVTSVNAVGLGVDMYERQFRGPGIHGFFDESRVWETDVRWGPGSLRSLANTEVAMESKSAMIKLRPDPYVVRASASWTAKDEDPGDSAFDTIDMMAEAMICCKKEDGTCVQGFAYGGLVVTFDTDQIAALKWDGSKDEEYRLPVWEQPGLRVYAGLLPDDTALLEIHNFVEWEGEDVRVVYRDERVHVVDSAKVFRVSSTLGYIKGVFPTVALGALCASHVNGLVCGFVCGIGVGWARVRFIYPDSLYVLDDVIEADVCPAVMLAKDLNCSNVRETDNEDGSVTIPRVSRISSSDEWKTGDLYLVGY